MAENRDSDGVSDIHAWTDQWVLDKCHDDSGSKVGTGFRSRAICNCDGSVPGTWVGWRLDSRLVLDHLSLVLRLDELNEMKH